MRGDERWIFDSWLPPVRVPARVSNGKQNCLSLILVGRRNFDTTAEQCVGNERGKHEKKFQLVLQLHLSPYEGFPVCQNAFPRRLARSPRGGHEDSSPGTTRTGLLFAYHTSVPRPP